MARIARVTNTDSNLVRTFKVADVSYVIADTRSGKVRRGRPAHDSATAHANLRKLRTDSQGRFNPAKNRSLAVVALVTGENGSTVIGNLA